MQNGAVDCEQHDIGRCDVEWYAKDPFECHIQGADESIERVSPMGDEAQPDKTEQWTQIAIGQKHERRDR